MGIRSIRKEPSEAAGPVYRYGMLVFILVLFAWQIHLHLMLPPAYPYDRYGNHVCILMLLFNHLAMAFKWRRGVAVALWVLSWSWIVFGLFYILYLSHALYPSSPSLFS
ncbi:MAG: hypothetical protein ACYS19_16540, partial [Planctomycetota bacterium]